MEVVHKLQEELGDLPDMGSGKDAEENDKIASDREKLQELIEEKSSAIQEYIQKLEYTKNQIVKYIGYFTIGQVLKIPYLNPAKEPSWGIFLGITLGTSAKNPYTYGNIHLRFAVADSRRLISYSLQPEEHAYISLIYSQSMDISEEERIQIPIEWNERIKKASSKREQRHILTENIVAASEAIGGENKLVKYNTKTGIIKNGILMDKEFGKDGISKALLPISEAFPRIQALSIDEFFSDQKDQLRFKRIGENYLQVYIHKGENYKMAIDPKLRELIRREEGQAPDELPDFVQNGGEMTGVLHWDHLKAFLKQLDTYGLQFLGKAKELEDWEIENQKEWDRNTKPSEGNYSYELGRPYGQGSNPIAGFKDYKEPEDTKYPFGVVSYTRPLSDKEKYNYSLIPIFKNAVVPYNAWKQAITGTPIEKEFESIVEKAKEQALYEAKDTLGFFITNNPHEDGNPEFVFGRYTEEELGRTAYEDRIGLIKPIHMVLDQLRLYHRLQNAS